jgi:hypothetical protein
MSWQRPDTSLAAPVKLSSGDPLCGGHRDGMRNLNDSRPPSSIPDGSQTAQQCAAEVADALAGRPLVSFERFTTAYRTCYTGPWPVPVMRPALAIGCYPPWNPAKPAQVVAAEDTIGVRSRERRHRWPAATRPAALAALATLGAPPVVTGWYASPALRDLASGGVTAAVSTATRNTIEDKARLDDILEAAGVPSAVRIPAITVHGTLPSLHTLRRKLGVRDLVVQAGVTSGGRGTFIIGSERDLKAAARRRGPYRVAAFIDGWSSNITVLSVPDQRGGVRVYADRPSHKATGITEVGIGTAKSAGNDWSRPWPAQAAATLIEAAVRVGEWAWAEHRMAGLFGLDAILTGDGHVMVNEINCRNQGTTEVSGVNQQLRGLPPLVAAHLLVMLGRQPGWLGDCAEFNQASIDAAIQPGPGPFYAKIRLTGASPARLDPGFPGPGIYQLDHGSRLQYVRAGAHPAQADTLRGEVLIANTPATNITCYPGAEIATLEGLAVNGTGPFASPNSLAPEMRRFVTAYRDLFRTQPPPRTRP